MKERTRDDDNKIQFALVFSVMAYYLPVLIGNKEPDTLDDAKRSTDVVMLSQD